MWKLRNRPTLVELASRKLTDALRDRDPDRYAATFAAKVLVGAEDPPGPVDRVPVEVWFDYGGPYGSRVVPLYV